MNQTKNQTKNLKIRRADNFVTFPVICDFSLSHWSNPEELKQKNRLAEAQTDSFEPTVWTDSWIFLRINF